MSNITIYCKILQRHIEYVTTYFYLSQHFIFSLDATLN